MDLTLSVVCDDARERSDGKIDFVGVFDELRAPGFPAVQDRMTVVLTLAWEAEEAGRQPIRADLMDPDDEMVLTIQGHTDVPRPRPDDPRRPITRIIMPLENVVFPRPGLYHFRLTAAGGVRRACSLHVGEADG
jgi:hypothetical protein